MVHNIVNKTYTINTYLNTFHTHVVNSRKAENMVKLKGILEWEAIGLTFIQSIILMLFQTIKDDRTISSVYYIIVGKKSSQTIQDIHLYNLTRFFRSYPMIKKEEFDQQIRYLENNQLLIVDYETNRATPTKKAENSVKQFINLNPYLTCLNGWQYHKIERIFWCRLDVLVQTVSNIIHYENRFIPIQTDRTLHTWVKSYVKQWGGTRYELSKKLYDELFQLLHDTFPVKQEIIIFRLSGYKHIGKTNEQIADLLQMEKSQYYFQFLSALHYIISHISTNKSKYPCLSELIDDNLLAEPYTNSTLRTKQLLEKNYSLEQIAQTRKLKMSTIEDHVVEIVLQNHTFPIETFVNEHQMLAISEVIKRTQSKKLTQIKNELKDISFFQIRLVLARMDVGNC